MKSSIRFFLFFILFGLALGDTYISSDIASNTIWTLSNSPYYIDSTITVQSGTTLTINPGVQVRFNDTTGQLVISGNLIAIGTSVGRIKFTSGKQVNNNWIIWRGLRFTVTSTSAAFDASGDYVSGCTLQYVDIEYARSASINAAIELEAQSPFLSNVDIWSQNTGIRIMTALVNDLRIYDSRFHGGQRGIYSTVSAPILNLYIRDSIFESFSSNAIYLTFISKFSSIFIEGSAFSSINSDAIYVTGCRCNAVNDPPSPWLVISTSTIQNCHRLVSGLWLSLEASNNTIINNLYDAIYLAPYYEMNYTIINNLFRNNGYNGILVANSYWGHYRWFGLISGNTFVQNGRSALSLFHSQRDVEISNNIFENTVCNNNYDLVSLSMATSLAAPIQFIGNTFVNNTCRWILNHLTHTSGTPHLIEGNRFVNNTALATSPASIIRYTGRQLVFHHNVLSNPSSNYEIAFDDKFTVIGIDDIHFLNFTLNWWGTTVDEEINQKIRHIMEDGEIRTHATYFPCLQSENPNDVSSSTYSPFVSGNEIGGLITEDTFLPLSGSPYTVTKSILILNGNLTIEAGVELIFGTNKALIVESELFTVGTNSSPIKFISPGMIFFTSRSAGATLDADLNYLGGSILSFCSISQSKILGGIGLRGTPPFLENVSIIGSTGHGLFFRFSSGHLVMKNVTVSNNTQNGIHIESSAVSPRATFFDVETGHNLQTGLHVFLASNITLERFKSIGNQDHGIYVTRSPLYLTEGEISHNEKRGIFVLINIYNFHVISITDSHISFSKDTAVHIQTSWNSYRHSVFMRRNVIELNSVTNSHAVFLDSTVSPGTILVEDNSINDNIAGGTNSYVIYILQNSNARIDFLRNNITRNTGRFILYYDAPQTVERLFHRNRWTDNTATGTPPSTINIRSGLTSVFFEETIVNPNNLYEFYVQTLANPLRINATHNWWGFETDEQVIDRIYDFRDNGNLATVEHFPFLLSDDPSDVGYNVTRASFVVNGTIQGVLEEDLTLTKDGSPYTIIGDLLISSTATLTIEPGVELLVDSNKLIAIQGGKLIAQGTSDEPILFTRSSMNRWSGIRFTQESGAILNGTTYVSGSILRHCIIEYAGQTQTSTVPSLDIQTSSTYPFLDGVEVRFGASHGIQFSSCTGSTNLYMRNVTSNSNTLYGIHLTCSGLNAILESCETSSNSQSGIYINPTNSTTLISHKSWFNLHNGIYAQATHLFVYQSNITGNSQRGIRTYETRTNDVTEIKDCEIVGNNQGALFLNSLQNWRNPTRLVRNNKIGSNNAPSSSFYIIYIDGTDAGLNEFTNNIVEDNICNSCWAIYLYQTSGGILFTNNTIFNNRGTRILQLQTLSATNLLFRGNRWIGNTATASPFTTIHLQSGVANVFYEESFVNPNIYEFYVAAPASIQRINATHNYWGVQTELEVMDKIRDFKDGANVATVEYWPFLLSEDPNDIGYNVTRAPIQQDCVIQAIDLSYDVQLDSVTCPEYLVTGTISVPSGFTLTIDPGVVLKFQSGVALQIQGQLIARGTENSPIIFTTASLSPLTYWRGILFNTGSVGATYDNSSNYLSGSILEYCVISRAGFGSTPALDITGTIDAPFLNHVNIIQNLHRGYFLGSPTSINLIKLSNCNISNNGNTGLYFTVGSNDLSIIIENSIFKSNSQYGLEFYSTGAKADIFLDKIIVEQNNNGLYTSFSPTGNLTIIDSTFVGNNNGGLSTNSGHLVVRRSYFSGTSNNWAIQYNINNFGTHRILSITDNIITGNRDGIYIYNYRVHNFEIEIRNNNISSCRRAIYNDGYQQHLIENNEIVNNNCQSQTSCSTIEVRLQSSQSRLDIKSNLISSNTGESIVNLDNLNNNRPIEISGNDVFDNFASKLDVFLPVSAGGAVFLLKGEIFNLFGNSFTNPSSFFEVGVTKDGNYEIPAFGNWWGSVDEEEILNRIFDKLDNPSRGLVNASQYLLAPNWECLGVNNCSGKGDCIRTDVCSCISGWQGDDCSEISCRDVYHCNFHGTCIGPNTCDCDQDWKQPYCLEAYCTQSNECNGRGFCVSPNVCLCYEGFTEESDCVLCKNGYWGPNCLPCPACVNGNCTSDGQCACEPRWAGALCNQCAPTFFGPNCLPLAAINYIAPTVGNDVGGTVVSAFGYNFKNTSSWQCRFATTNVPASWSSETRIICSPSPVGPSNAHVNFRLVENGNIVTYGALPQFYYNALCPNSACNNGICSRGECICNFGYYGPTCDFAQIPLVLGTLPNVTLPEFSPFASDTPTVIEGTTPIEWALLEGPQGMTINTQTGVVSWNNVLGNLNQFKITIRANNGISTRTITFYLQVVPSYYCNATTSATILPLGSQVQIQGFCRYLNNSATGTVSVSIWVYNFKTGNRVFQHQTYPNGYFIFYFSPSSNEAGHYSISAFHPASPYYVEEDSFVIVGFRLTSTYRSLSGVPGMLSLNNQTGLQNIGNTPLTGIVIEIFGTDSILHNVSVQYPTSLAPQETVGLYITTHSNEQWIGNIIIRFSSTNLPLTPVTLTLGINYADLKPVLTASPSSINLNIPRGNQTLVGITIQNTGFADTGTMQVFIPSHPFLTLISPPILSSLAPGGIASISISLNPPADASFGSLTGQFSVSSSIVSRTINFKFDIVSTVLNSLTILVEDEFTYYAEGNPRVADATVTVRNQQTGVQFTKLTNPEGVAFFEDITQGNYKLTVQKLGHGTHTSTLLLESSNTNRTVFLPRQVVSYVWTVTPTQIQDKYIFTLEAQFSTNVPIPVITVEPSLLSTDDVYYGGASHLYFNVTNHGLIAADNGRFEFGTFNKMELIPLLDPVGPIPANSSVIVPVKIIRDYEKTVNHGDWSWSQTQETVTTELRTNGVLKFTATYNNITDQAIFSFVDTPEYDFIEYNFTEGTGLLYFEGFQHGAEYLYNSIQIAREQFLQRRALVIEEIFYHDFSRRDNPGCDGPVVDGVCNTPCCALHDECYAQNGCTMYTWIEPLSTTCQRCNMDAVRCISSNLFCCNSILGTGPAAGNPCSCNEHRCFDECRPAGSFYCVDAFVGCGAKTPCPDDDSDDGGNNPILNCIPSSFKWDLVCDGTNTYNLRINFRTFGNGPCITPKPVPPPSGGGGSSIGPTGCVGCGVGISYSYPAVISQPQQCDPCLKKKLECLIGYTPLGCGYSAVVAAGSPGLANIVSAVAGCLGGPITNTIFCIYNILECELSNSKRDTADAIAEAYLNLQAGRMVNYINYITAPLGEMVNVLPQGEATEAWIQQFSSFTADQSSNGAFVDEIELQELLSMLPTGVDSSLAISTIARWNRTLQYWDTGFLTIEDVPQGLSTDFMEYTTRHQQKQQLDDDLQAVAQEGFSSLGAAFHAAVENFNLEINRKEQGACAKVTIKIEQELVLTRNAFIAKLEIQNDGSSPLQNMSVVIKITKLDGTVATNVFAIGQPSLTGIGGTDMSGNGVLNGMSSGFAEWLLIPKREAAPTKPAFYDIGGTFSYVLDGILVENPLWPDTIQVFPDPLLEVKYFWQKDVYSDDPFTPEIEPPEPFYLGLLITNKGYGAAQNMRMTSSQPQIIENERGLLIDFQIIGVQVNQNEVSPSLTVFLGTLAAQSSIVVRWILTASLQGQFISYSASYEHISPIGDADISLIENVTIHELIHVVHIEGSDELPDFLTNEIIDPWALPDTVHSSFNSSVYPVYAVLNFTELDRQILTDGLQITISVPVPAQFIYIRIEDFVGAEFILTQVQRSDNFPLRLDENVWRTSRIKRFENQDPIQENYFHIFDSFSTGIYTITFGGFPPVSNLIVSSVTWSTATLEWQSTNATHFMIQLKVSHQSTYAIVQPFLQFNFFTLSNLIPETEYSARIFASNGGSFETTGATVEFTTLVAPTTQPPITTEVETTPQTPTIPSTTEVSPTSAIPNPSSNSSNNLGIIVGSVVGGLIALSFIGVAIFLIIKRKKSISEEIQNIDVMSHHSDEKEFASDKENLSDS